MRSLLRGAYALCLVAAFFVICGLLAQAYTYLTAESYAQGAVPNRNFPVVAIRQNVPQAATVQYQLLGWWEIDKKRASGAPLTFKLPEHEGHFALASQEGEYAPHVDFKVIETTGNRQVIQVTSFDEDYVFYSKYSTDGTTVWPAHLRTWGANSYLIALVPAALLTWLLGLVVARGWKKRSSAQAPAPG